MKRHRRLNDIRKSALIGYISHHDRHSGEILDHVRLDRIFAPTVERVFTRIEEKNAEILAAGQSDDLSVRKWARTKRVTGPATKRRIKASISTVLADAMRERLVSFDAAALVSLAPAKKSTGLVWTKARVQAFNDAFAEHLQAVKADRRSRRYKAVEVWSKSGLRPSPVMVWTPAQLSAFLDHAITDRLYALFHLIAFRGLRRGEACGARWVDLDLDEGWLAVAKQLTIVDSEIAEGGSACPRPTTTTGASWRSWPTCSPPRPRATARSTRVPVADACPQRARHPAPGRGAWKRS
ncbi:hypothetical protein [Nonomuraea rubra]|uniref:hypothetical protein n=1 Tax=Nonomuraea rubra TaxID=46180 RepID=UPI0033CAB408